MDESSSAAIAALLIASLPFVVLGLLFLVIVLIAGVLFGLGALFEKPPRYWLLAIMVALNAIILVPVWGASCLVARSDPAAWASVQEPVFTFSAFLVLPTAAFYAWCELKTHRTKGKTSAKQRGA